MELNLKNISVEEISGFLNKIKHLTSKIEVNFSFEGKKVTFVIDLTGKYYIVENGPYLSSAPQEEWFTRLLCSPGPHDKSFEDIDQLVGDIYTIMYVVAMPEII